MPKISREKLGTLFRLFLPIPSENDFCMILRGAKYEKLLIFVLKIGTGNHLFLVLWGSRIFSPLRKFNMFFHRTVYCETFYQTVMHYGWFINVKRRRDLIEHDKKVAEWKKLKEEKRAERCRITIF